MTAIQFAPKCKTIFLIVVSILLGFNISMADSGFWGGDKDVKVHSNKIKKIVLDAGHGGKDSGALGKTSKEKDISLNLTLKLGKAIEKQYPDVEVIYTRKTDKFIELHERARIANEANADLFISIHCNSAANAQAHGTETFVLGLHRSKDNLEVAKRENAAILFEENYQENYDGFDPSSETSHIILNMYQNTYLDRSIAFANSLESDLKDQYKRKSRGVKQAGFLVLRNTFMPSILFEAGFVTNAEEEKFLNSASGQEKIVQCFLKALANYKKTLEENPQLANVKTEKQNSPALAAAGESTQPDVKAESEKPRTKVIKTVAELEREEAAAKNPEQTAKEVAADTPKKENQPAPAQPDKNSPEIEFCVQLAASAKKENLNSTRWRNIQNLSVRFENKMYKYQITGITSYSEASKAKDQMKSRGFKEAFIVAYNNGNRIDVSEAVSLSK